MEKLNKVCTNFEQDFTEAEKAQARRNIGAQQELIEGSNIQIVGNTISAIVPTPEPQPIPEVNDAQLTIQKNGTTVGTFTANASVPSVVNIEVPSVGAGVLTIQKNGTTLEHFSANSSVNKTVDIRVPTKTSDITNDSGFITSADLPAVGNGQITIQKNGNTVDSFTVNQSSAKTINITVPTKNSDLQNDNHFVTETQLTNAIGTGVLTIQRNGVNVQTFGANETQNKTANIIVPDNLFVATYGVSTWQELEDAYDAGKAIVLVGADFGNNIHTQMPLYDFNTTSGQTRKFCFAPTVTPRVAAYYRYYAVLDETDGWSKNYLSGTAPTKCGGIFQLTGDEATHNLIEHRGWLCNEVYNFDVRFFSSPNACNIYIGYVTGNQSLKVDVVGTRRNVRNDLKAQIDQTTTVQTYVRDIDAWSRIVKVEQPLTSADLRIDLATLGPQEQSNYNYDIYWDLDLIFHQWGVTGSTSPCYHLHIEKYGDPGAGHSYLFGTLAGTDLY
jgi:hypothetical protein